MRRQAASGERVEDTLLGGCGRGGADEAVDVADVRESKDVLGQIGRLGSMSLIVFSIVHFLGSVMLPWVVRSPEDEKMEFTPRPPTSIAPILDQIERDAQHMSIDRPACDGEHQRILKRDEGI